MAAHQNIDGTRNITAGRDISLSFVGAEQVGSVYNAILSPVFTAIDGQIQSLYPKKLISPTTPGQPQDFSSERLFHSLSILGIPVRVALFVVENLEQELKLVEPPTNQLSTHDIRRAVAHILYHHKPIRRQDGTRQDPEYWGDLYIRRYGNPEQKISVIHSDGSHDELDYQFLRKRLVPDAMEKILGMEKFERFRQTVTDSDVSAMAEEIFRGVRALDLYRIHYSMLLSLATEIALQPPHPWLVSKAFDLESVSYDYSRAKKHCDAMQCALQEDDLDSCLFFFRECAHHSCSAILAYYGLFMGCGYLSPVHTLHRTLGLLAQNKPIEATVRGEFDIKANLKNAGIRLHDLSRCVKLIRENVRISANTAKENIALAAKVAESLFGYCDKLLHHFLQLHELDHQVLSEIANEQELLELATKTMKLMPGFQVQVRKPRVWLVHSIENTLFKNIKPRILLAAAYSSADRQLKPQDFAQWTAVVTNRSLTNCIIYVTAQELGNEFEALTQSISAEGLVLLKVSIKKLLEAALSDDPVDFLVDVLLDC